MIRIIFGNEPYFISQIKKDTFDIVLDRDFNLSMHEIFDEKVYDLCTTYPVMEEKRVVYLDLDKLSMLDNESFNAYLAAPADFTELLILCRKVDKNTKFAKKLKKDGFLLEISKLKEENVLKTTIQKLVAEKGGSISPNALTELLARENYFENDAVNLISISHDIDSMLNINKNISLNMVKGYIKDMSVEDVFALAKLIEKENIQELKREISLISPDKAILTLSLLLREYRISYKAIYTSLSDIGAKYLTFRSMSKEQLIHGMTVCTSIIEDIKKGKLSDELALQYAIGQLFYKKGGNA